MNAGNGRGGSRLSADSGLRVGLRPADTGIDLPARRTIPLPLPIPSIRIYPAEIITLLVLLVMGYSGYGACVCVPNYKLAVFEVAEVKTVLQLHDRLLIEQLRLIPFAVSTTSLSM